MTIFGSREHEWLRLEGERLKRRILHLERFDGLKRHVEQVLGRYLGGYKPGGA